MSVFANVTREAGKKNLPFLLIGGYAVLAHGFVRTTGDMDFLIRKSQASDWQKLLEELKFVVKFSSPTFLQFAPPPEEKLPLDLMFVRDEDFAKMFADAKQIDSDGFIAKVVSLPHLFALKCHAFKSRPLRAMKDIEDLVQLTRLNKLDLNEPVLRDIFSSTVDRNSMNSSNGNATHFILSDAADLKFPDWNGMKPHEIRMSPTEAFRWNEEMLALFPPRKISPKLEAERRCHTEFVL
jgi:predicted nucleotidyltransferase